jgi:hypothetical protein
VSHISSGIPLVRRSPARLAFCAVIALCLVAACGPADRGYRPGDGAGPATAQPGQSAPAALNGVESIVAAPGLKVEVEWPSGTRDPVVRSLVDSYVSQWRAVGSGGKDESYLSGVEDEASRDSYTWVRGFLSVKQSAQGVAKLYALRLASVTGRGAEVDACVDESGLKLTDTAGAPIPDQPTWTKPPHAVYLQVAALHKGDDGAWRIKLFRHAAYPDERAKECAR